MGKETEKDITLKKERAKSKNGNAGR